MTLTFHEYLLQRPRRYTAVGTFVADRMHDDEFAAINSQEELDAYLALRKIGPNGRMHAYAVWRSYLNAKKRHHHAVALRSL